MCQTIRQCIAIFEKGFDFPQNQIYLRLIHFMVLAGVIFHFNYSWAQTKAPLMCHQLFISDEAMQTKIQSLAETAVRLKNDDSIRGDVRSATENQYRTQLNELVRLFPHAWKKYLDELAKMSPNKFIKKNEKIKEKEKKIELYGVYEQLFKLMESNTNFSENVIDLIRNLSGELRTEVLSTVQNVWPKEDLSTRERKFASRYLEILQEYIYEGKIERLNQIMDLQMFDINTQNESGFSILMVAAYADQKNVIDWILQNPHFKILKKNQEGFTDVEQLRRMNRNEIADYIVQIRPEAKSQRFRLKERNHHKTEFYPNGTPIIAFIDILPGKVRLSRGQSTFIITDPFQYLSVNTTNKMWKTIALLANKELNYHLNPEPSFVTDDMNPVENMSYNDAMLWHQAATELSKLDIKSVQEKLKSIFPKHQKGDIYRLPTLEESIYVSHLMGFANGRYSHGNSLAKLEEFAVFDSAMPAASLVGTKKSMFIYGKAIYDIQGNVSEFVHDSQVVVGSFQHTSGYLVLNTHSGIKPLYKDSSIGLRSVRIRP